MMNEYIIKEISQDLGVTFHQVQSTLQLLEEGNTIPFIARYRKEATNNLDEEQIRKISEVYEYQVGLLKRKEDVIRLIGEKGLLTEELKNAILKCNKLVEVEDIYRPYKEKKKTKATDAILAGLEPLAKIMMSFPKSIQYGPFIHDQIKSEEEAITGAKYIIAEWVSDNANYRKWIREYIVKNGTLSTKLKKNAVDEEKVYEMYYSYQEAIRMIKPHRVLAINRAEALNVIQVSIDINSSDIISYLEKKIVKDQSSCSYLDVMAALIDSYKRLLFPSIEREIRSELTEIAENKAIEVFMDNLEKLLLQPPMKEKIILGLDPAYRTGCKLAVIDHTGKMIHVSVIYPHEPRNEVEKSKKQVLDLIEKYQIDIIAIGNGTASRESETFISEVIKAAKRKVEFILVNEAGASVYSASPLAISEFPDLHVEERSAISIARRLQDPLSELVKIDSKSIGVGQYQHDVSPKKLRDSLDFVVSKAVNQVGVNINTASASILSYISGVTNKATTAILAYREKKGKIETREEIKKIKGISPKLYEQAIGFIRIVDGKNQFDKTSIHPESYQITENLLHSRHLNENDLGTPKLKEIVDKINLEKYAKENQVDYYTLEDIVKSLKQPSRDPRDEFDKPLLKSDILKLEDLKRGMKLQGTVRNVVDFGVFIDIGIKNDGLAHISKLTNHYIKHPSEVLSVGEIVDCYVEEIYLDKKKVSLSLLKPKEGN